MYAQQSSTFTGTPSQIYDDSTWDEYLDVLSQISSFPRIKAPKDCDRQPVVEFLSQRDATIIPPPLDDQNLNLQAQLKDHKHQFAEQFQLEPTQMNFLLQCLAYFGDFCAKRKAVVAATVAWNKFRQTGMVPRERMINTYLYVLSSEGTDGPVEHVLEAATFHSTCYTQNENTSYLRIQFLILQGNIEAARDILLAPVNGTSWQKLRTFLPLLEYYLMNDEIPASLELLSVMRASPGVVMDDETYALVLSQMASKGYFAPHDAPKITTGAWRSGPGLLDNLLQLLAEDVLELSPETANIVYRGFLQGFQTDPAVDDTLDCSLYESKGIITVGKVLVNNTSAICEATGAHLRLFSLTPEQRQSVNESLVEMAATQHEEFNAKLKAKGRKFMDRGDAERAQQKLNEFSEWLRAQPEPYTAIVDGANVAYADHGNLHYSQVMLAVDALEALGEKPLVVMPSKYMERKFYLSGIDRVQELTDREEEILQDLVQSKRIYEVPPSLLDDYYWMIASVADPRSSRLVVDVENSEGRFPGLRPMLVTNDQMRDHKLSLMEQRLFRRWTSCYIVNYKLLPYHESEWEGRDVEFSPADFFSREVQGNPAGTSGNCGTAWHLPVTTWEANERLCINIQNRDQ